MGKCFADNLETGKCDALKVKECDGCSFYKTEQQITKERCKADERLKKLGIYEDCKTKYKTK
jgi:hypothetical protein